MRTQAGKEVISTLPGTTRGEYEVAVVHEDGRVDVVAECLRSDAALVEHNRLVALYAPQDDRGAYWTAS